MRSFSGRTVNASMSPGLIARPSGGGHEQPVTRRRLDLQEIAGAARDLGLDDVRRPDEPGDESRGRSLVDVFGVADLLDLALRHHRDAVAHHERLFLVVRDVDERDADLALDAHQLELHLLAELEVEAPSGSSSSSTAGSFTSARASATRCC